MNWLGKVAAVATIFGAVAAVVTVIHDFNVFEFDDRRFIHDEGVSILVQNHTEPTQNMIFAELTNRSSLVENEPAEYGFSAAQNCSKKSSKAENYKKMIDVASRVYKTTARDLCYYQILSKALSENNYDVAFDVAEKIDQTKVRDNAYVDIMSAAVLRKETDLASKAVDQIYYSSVRDEARLRLLEGLISE